MTGETAAGGNAAENVMKKNSKVNVSLHYRTKISKIKEIESDKREKPQTRPGPQTLRFARIEHY